MDYLTIAKKKIRQIIETQKPNISNDKNDKNDKRDTKIRFTKATDPYHLTGNAKNYWKFHVPTDQHPQWVKEVYGLN